jgi:hypothetical protein
MGTTGIDSKQQMNENAYAAFLAHVRATFAKATSDKSARLFYVDMKNVEDDADDDVPDLTMFDEYLAHIHPAQRQVHDCAACRSFMKRYGSLVTINEQGKVRSAVWNAEGYDGPYEDVIRTLRSDVALRPIKGVFLTKQFVLGQPRTGGYYGEPEWTHLSLDVPKHLVLDDPINTERQVMAKKRESYKDMLRALGDYKLETVNRALALLESEKLYRAEKVIGPCRFLRDTIVEREKLQGKRAKANALWLRVALAPEGFAQPRSSMIGTLLDDLQDPKLDFKAVKARFADKMKPTNYATPKAAPKAGNIQRAETIIQKLNGAGALERRYALASEVQTIWTPQARKAKAEATDGVFAHLQPKGTQNQGNLKPYGSPTVMTWARFRSKVLPDAVRIQAYVPNRASFGAYTTAQYPEAERILQWDDMDNRNPFAWYVYPDGSFAHQWNLPADSWLDVLGISMQPTMWGGENKFTHFGEGALIMLPGCKDGRHKSAGNALFPQCLRSELHEVRATIEAYSRGAKLHGFDEPGHAAGLKFSKDNDLRGYLFRVQREDGEVLSYALDRWI